MAELCAKVAIRDDGLLLGLWECFPSRPRRPNAPRFLLVHGFAQNHRSFREGPLPGLLVDKGARVFLADLRGHGQSRSLGPASGLMEHLQKDLPAFMRTLQDQGDGPLVYLGHSMGGVLGYLALTEPDLAAGIDQLWTFGAPIHLARRRPDIRLAALGLRGLAPWLPQKAKLPVDQLLKLLSGPLSKTDPNWAEALLQEWAALASPPRVDPSALMRVLRAGDPEAPGVLSDMTQLLSRRGRIQGRDLVRAIQQAAIPIAAVAGSRDLFAPLSGMGALFSGPQAGKRRLLSLQGAGHLDVCMARDLARTVDLLWAFSFSA